MASSINASTAGSGGVITTADNSGVLNIQTAGTTAVTVDASQNVGIGTTSPAANRKLTVETSGDTVQRISSTGASNGLVIEFLNNGTGRGAIGNGSGIISGGSATTFGLQSVNEMVFASGGYSERMRIDSSGRVLVNATSIIGSDTAPFQVTGGTVTAITVKGGSNNYFEAFYNTSSTLIGSITGSNGSTTAYNTTSDYRLKENVAPMTGALAKVQALKPVTYTWKATGEESQGFIAHELAEIVPDCVTGEKDAVEIVDDVDDEGKVIGTKEIIKPQGIDTSFLVATLTAAIQEQQTMIESLKADVATLKGTA